MILFVVEDGSGLSDASSYTAVAFADSYLGSDWATDNDAKETALIRGTEYIDLRWGSRLLGSPLNAEQALEFPRQGLWDRYGRAIEGVPVDVQKAVCLYAEQSIKNTLYDDPVKNEAEIKRKKTVVGPVTTETEFRDQIVTHSGFNSFSQADSIMKEFIYSAQRVIRA